VNEEGLAEAGPSSIVTDELRKILEEARRRPMTADEREEQLRNFAAGNVGLENERVTRAVVDEAARRMTITGSR
jgi:hypothetical protein